LDEAATNCAATRGQVSLGDDAAGSATCYPRPTPWINDIKTIQPILQKYIDAKEEVVLLRLRMADPLSPSQIGGASLADPVAPGTLN
jgi:hypothetical protein